MPILVGSRPGTLTLGPPTPELRCKGASCTWHSPGSAEWPARKREHSWREEPSKKLTSIMRVMITPAERGRLWTKVHSVLARLSNDRVCNATAPEASPVRSSSAAQEHRWQNVRRLARILFLDELWNVLGDEGHLHLRVREARQGVL